MNNNFEIELLSEYTSAMAHVDIILEKMNNHFGYLIEEALEANDTWKANKILDRIPESRCRFEQWKKINLKLKVHK